MALGSNGGGVNGGTRSAVILLLSISALTSIGVAALLAVYLFAPTGVDRGTASAVILGFVGTTLATLLAAFRTGQNGAQLSDITTTLQLHGQTLQSLHERLSAVGTQVAANTSELVGGRRLSDPPPAPTTPEVSTP